MPVEKDTLVISLPSVNYCIDFFFFSNLCSLSSLPGGGSHDAASILSFGLAAALRVMSHAKVVAHFVSHSGSDTNC